jgi:hypothetical protein
MSRARIAPVIGAAVVSWTAATVVDPQSAVAADGGLLVSSHARYEVLPAENRVHVTLDASATNATADTATERFYYDGLTLPVPPGVDGITALAEGGSLATSIVEATEEYTAIEVHFGRGVFSGETYRFSLSFDIVDPGGAPGRTVRIRPSFVAFPVWAFGTSRTPGGSVEVVIPAGYQVHQLAGDMQRVKSADAVILTATEITDPDAFFAYVSAERPGDQATTELAVTVGGSTAALVIRAWPDDPDWGSRVSSIYADALPALSEAIGLPYPIVGPLTVSEHAFAYLGDYAGTYDPITDEISMRYDADAFVMLHEAAHIWFNEDLFAERWIAEAFASYYAEVTGTVIGVPAEAFVVDPKFASLAFPLEEWGDPGFEDPVREDYAYAATNEVARQIAAVAGADGLRRVWQAADANLSAYQPLHAGEPEGAKTIGVSDWQRLLDLLETHTGADFDPIWIEWIATPDQRPLLAQREGARAAYIAAVEEAGAWDLPASVRELMATWRFEAAHDELAQIDALLAQRDEITRTAADLELTPPGTLEHAFEDQGIEEAEAVARAELEALDAIRAAEDRLDDELLPVEWVGMLWSAAPFEALERARGAYLDARPADATREAGAAIEQRDAAAAAGRERVGSVGGVVLALDTLFLGALMLRRRRGRAQLAYRAG